MVYMGSVMFRTLIDLVYSISVSFFFKFLILLFFLFYFFDFFLLLFSPNFPPSSC